MNLKKLLYQNPDGISFKKNGSDYIPVYFKTGYFVALTDNEVTGRDRKQVIKEIQKLARDLNIKTYFYGYWKDNKTQKEYLDLSLHKTNKKEAVILGRQFNQKAIFDCLKLDSVYI